MRCYKDDGDGLAGMSESLNTSRSLTDSSHPAESAFGLGMAALIMAIFGFIWLGWGFSVSSAFTNFSSGSLAPAIRWLSFYAVFVGLLVVSVQAVRKSKKRMMALSVSPKDFRSGFGKSFRVIALFEGIGCGVVALLAIAFHRLDLLAAGISFVVGLHFLPLGRLFRFPAYYVAGILIVVFDLVSIVLLRAESITLSVDVTTGAVLWITAVYALLRFVQVSSRPGSSL